MLVQSLPFIEVFTDYCSNGISFFVAFIRKLITAAGLHLSNFKFTCRESSEKPAVEIIPSLNIKEQNKTHLFQFNYICVVKLCRFRSASLLYK